MAAPSTVLIRENLMLLSCSEPIQFIWWGIQLLGLSRVTKSPCLPYMVGRGIPDFVPPDDTVDFKSGWCGTLVILVW